MTEQAQDPATVPTSPDAAVGVPTSNPTSNPADVAVDAGVDSVADQPEHPDPESQSGGPVGEHPAVVAEGAALEADDPDDDPQF